MSDSREVSELVKVDIDDVIGNDLDGFLSLLAELAGDVCLMDLNYSIEGHEGDTLLIRVTGVKEDY